jgi:uncharacterized protein YecE (DUF72 family)
MRAGVFVGTAGWSLSPRYAAEFATAGTHLERYAARFNCVEINSSFSSSHQLRTYERWARTVPATFRFSAKLPRLITHENRLENFAAPLQRFLEQIGGLGDRLGPLLVQLPPSLVFTESIARPFFEALLRQVAVPVLCEPRHESWNTVQVDRFLASLRIARVAADPAPWPSASEPGGWTGLSYFRLHGHPRTYYSDYETSFLKAVRRQITSALERSSEVWCILDNTALGHATGNALTMATLLQAPLEGLYTSNGRACLRDGN